MHLKLHTFNNDSEYLQNTQQIVTDYIEKLIQIPYRIPKLSASEIETYNNLLFSLNLLNSEEFQKIYYEYLEFRRGDFYSPFSFGNIKEIISLDDKTELSNLLNISHFMSQMITNVLKGNPRQTKRFLNTFILRRKLAQVASLEIDILILIKLMLLEYLNPTLFKKLNELQSGESGIVLELGMLESVFIDGEENKLGEGFKDWQTPQIQNWIRIEPKIGNVDLRNYFWLVRDKTESTMSNIHMVSPIIQKLYSQISSTDKHQRSVGFIELKKLDELVKDEVFELLNNELLNNPSKTRNLLDTLFDYLEKIDNEKYAVFALDSFKKMSFALIKNERKPIDILKFMKSKHKKLTSGCDELIDEFSQKESCLLQKTAMKAKE
ncbi:MAG: hypothetical protein KN64_15080 [Sulfurovum sp. AS07-7]|nr:MAG: hypothetical protein KN64_15080 [Sulfurovum sp. AS07-7]